MKKQNPFNEATSSISPLSRSLTRIKGRWLHQSPDSVALARSNVADIRRHLATIERELDKASGNPDERMSTAREPKKADDNVESA